MGIFRASICDHEPGRMQKELCKVNYQGYVAVEMTYQLLFWAFYPIETTLSEMGVPCQCRLSIQAVGAPPGFLIDPVLMIC